MSAVKRYNKAASHLNRPTLQLDTVMKYVTIGQFDILCLSCYNITEKPWTWAPEQSAVIKYFKLLHSHKEIQRLDIEIQRLHTYIIESEASIENVIQDLDISNPLLAAQMCKCYHFHCVANRAHIAHLKDIESWEEFTSNQNPLNTVSNTRGTDIGGDEADENSGMEDDDDIGDDEKNDLDDISSALDAMLALQ